MRPVAAATVAVLSYQTSLTSGVRGQVKTLVVVGTASPGSPRPHSVPPGSDAIPGDVHQFPRQPAVVEGTVPRHLVRPPPRLPPLLVALEQHKLDVEEGEGGDGGGEGRAVPGAEAGQCRLLLLPRGAP